LSEAQDGRIDGDNGRSRKARDEREMEIPDSSTAMPFPCVWARMRDLPWRVVVVVVVVVEAVEILVVV
jgi:hypothetical protein